MTKYEKGDKVLILCTVDYGEEGFTVLKESPLENPNILGKLEDFQPAEEKIKMTVEEKKEFDELKRQWVSIRGALSDVYDYGDTEFKNLHKKLISSNPKKDNEAQLEFSKAWEKPSRIEVVKPEHEFKAGDLVEIQGEKAIVLRVVSKLETPLQVSFKTDRDVGWIRKEDVSFIKSNAIDWEDGE